MEECRKHKINQKAGNFVNQIRTVRIFHPEYPDTPPGISGIISGVSGLIRSLRVKYRSIRLHS